MKVKMIKTAFLLQFSGEKVCDIYDVDKKDSGRTYMYTRNKESVWGLFSPQKNIQMEIYHFQTYS